MSAIEIVRNGYFEPNIVYCFGRISQTRPSSTAKTACNPATGHNPSPRLAPAMFQSTAWFYDFPQWTILPKSNANEAGVFAAIFAGLPTPLYT